MAPVVEIPKPSTDPREFYEATDWEAWYHEFSTSTARNGTWTYASAFEFAKVKGTTRKIRELILHVIGPVIDGRSVYPDIPQFDWEKRRKEGAWLGPEKLKDQIAKLTTDRDTLESLKASGQAFILPLLARCAAMFDQIESEFAGRIFLPGVTEKVNEARAALYMRLTDHCVKLSVTCQEAYARSMMLNLNDMTGTIALRDSVSSKAIAEKGKQSPAQQFLGNVVEMTFEKSKALKLPMPDADIYEIAEKYREP